MTTTKIAPEVGMGASHGYGSDSYPYTIVKVSPSGKKVTVQRDEVMVLEGTFTSAQMTYTTLPDPTAAEEEFSLRSNGRWHRVGCPVGIREAGLIIGTRRYYQDPSF